MNPSLCRTLAALTLFLAGAAGPLAADPQADAQARFDAAAEAARAAMRPGPADIPLGSQGNLQLPDGYAFIPQAQARAVLASQGDSVGPGFQGLIVGGKLHGFLVLEYEAAGYVKDGDAKDWDADQLLADLKEGTEAGNAERRRLGVPEFSVIGWVQPPRYDAATHRLVWSASTRAKVPQGAGDGVNYNTYVLGREGYFSMNLVTSLDRVEAEKPAAGQLLAALDFKPGKRYADFDASSDKVAEYGLAALVAGAAAKKLGLLAALGVFLVKAWKLVALAVLGVAAGARRFFGRKDNA